MSRYRTGEALLWPFFVFIALVALCLAIPQIAEVWHKVTGGLPL